MTIPATNLTPFQTLKKVEIKRKTDSFVHLFVHLKPDITNYTAPIKNQKALNPFRFKAFLLARRKGFEPLTFWSVATLMR